MCASIYIDTSEQANDRWVINEGVAFKLIAQSIAEGSQNTYATGWKAWKTFCSIMQIDPYLIILPQDFNVQDRGYTYEVSVVHAFCISEFFSRKVTASTVDNYLQGINFHLKCRGRNTEFLQSFPVVRVKAALN